MHARFLATVASAFLVSSVLVTGGAQAQTKPSQFLKDAEIKNPAAADASLARDEAKDAKKSAMTAKRAAKSPKAKAAASKAAKAADIAASEAKASAKEAERH
jgi:hypothetical protein